MGANSALTGATAEKKNNDKDRYGNTDQPQQKQRDPAADIFLIIEMH